MLLISDKELSPLVLELNELLKDKELTISTAESCTGGLIAALLTWAAGSSAFFHGGITSYSNEAKIKLLSVPPKLIEKHGAVSEEVVTAMVNGCAGALASNCSIAVTGIAGPGGGTTEKPVGTVWVGLKVDQKTWTRKLQLSGDRTEIRSNTARLSLDELLRYLRNY